VWSWEVRTRSHQELDNYDHPIPRPLDRIDNVILAAIGLQALNDHLSDRVLSLSRLTQKSSCASSSTETISPQAVGRVWSSGAAVRMAPSARRSPASIAASSATAASVTMRRGRPAASFMSIEKDGDVMRALAVRHRSTAYQSDPQGSVTTPDQLTVPLPRPLP
jgi:hypothetical protein